jgi:glycerol uptake facilitator-like aquaporin
VAPYIAAQFIAALAASFIVFTAYYDSLAAFDGGVRHVTGELATAGIWATYPQPFTSTAIGFVNEALGTAMLVGVILGITDTRNSPAPNGLTPVLVGLLVVGHRREPRVQHRLCHQPARDLGPRSSRRWPAGGSEVFTAAHGWWWVPVVAPCVGGVIGGWGYDVCVGHRFPNVHARTIEQV